MNTGYRYFIFLNSKNSGFDTKKGLCELFLHGRIRIYPMSVSEAPLGDPKDHKSAHLLVVDNMYASSLKKALQVCPIYGCAYGLLLEYEEKEGKEFEKNLRQNLSIDSRTRKSNNKKKETRSPFATESFKP